MRVFGSTPRGQTACVHMHEAFPHLLVPGPHWLASAPEERVAAFRRRVADSLDAALTHREDERAAERAARAQRTQDG